MDLYLAVILSVCLSSAAEAKTCSGGQFTCANGDCIARSWLCDGDSDCTDQSDEENCESQTCKESEFSCKNGLCVPHTWRCDNQPDCLDGSDEEDCENVQCLESQFRCPDGTCILQTWRCDSQSDCGDGSDEAGCEPVTCPGDTFPCDSKCISPTWVCDLDVDCIDQSDEANCSTVPARKCSERNEFTCVDGSCIHRSWQCDGEKDCTDGTDEINCGPVPHCNRTQFTCTQDSNCIPAEEKCDGETQCKDGSDERDCQEESRCSELEYMCANGDCVHGDSVCNCSVECSDASDEHNCTECNLCLHNNGGCEQQCDFHHGRMSCGCREGFKLQSDDVSCADIDECNANPSVCPQVCTNTVGRYQCSCVDGYIEDDGRCKALGDTAKLFFSARFDIREIDLETKETQIVANGGRAIIAIDVDVENEVLYYSDVGDPKLCRASLNRKKDDSDDDCTVIVNTKISTPDGIGLDWVHQNLYWSDTALDQISVTSLTGHTFYRKALISDGLDEPRAIVIDPREGQRWLYWTDWGTNPKIERAGLDGSNRMTLVSHGIVVWPNGLAIDFPTNRMYWIDAKVNQIGTARLDGTDVQIIYSDSRQLPQPFAVDVFEGSLFWTEWQLEGIYKLDAINGTFPAREVSNVYSPMGLRIHHKMKQPMSENVCGINNGGCSQLCLPTPAIASGSPKYVCAYDDARPEVETSTDAFRASTEVLPEASDPPLSEGEIGQIAGVILAVVSVVAIVSTLATWL